MTTLILSTATRYLLPLLLLFSVYLLLRGHNLPGGGFVGGLVGASAFVLYAIAEGVDVARRVFRVNPFVLIGLGLFTALVSGSPALLQGRPFMTGQWLDAKITFLGKLGTPLLFDIGVYCVVVGVVLGMVFSLMED